MSYYMLGCFGPLDQDSTEIHRIPKLDGVSWLKGARISAPVPRPIRLYLDPEQPGILLPMYYKGVLVFSDAMIAALQGAGVDNLELFEAVLVNPFQGKEHTDYKVANIVGVIAAADLAKSKHIAYGAPLFDVDFDSLFIDESKSRGALMFRLAENITGIVIHEQVKKSLEKAQIPYLNLTLPEKWLG